MTVTVHDGSVDGPVVATGKTGDDGAFRLDLPPGRYTVEVNHGGAARQVTVESGEYAAVTLLMRAK